ncbi:hypothetical protein BOTCAL_0231g00040 [Botryotinia calthae]|uniref:Clr5 domain-containing protein n=1 Tax=Botryotinia calthae TaxID=38488 RepID=A0A4Y8CZU9_9HELO|nr:hypothetical protein BOTCAL_0231g00040 [Botryotinia calthae]
MSGQTFIENHMLMDVEAQSSLSTGGHKVFSREEWLKFKPIIQQLYIDENQTYPNVARELSRRFNFCPTKRQFTRKTEEWGLKKNLRKAERKLLLQNNRKNGTAEFVIGDKRVSDPKRIQRLKRRYAHESPLSQDVSYQDTNISLESAGPYFSLEEQLSISDYPYGTTSMDQVPQILGVTEESSAMDLEQLPFSRENDVHGSLGLTRLFQRLEIEASMPPLDLDDEVMETKQTISGNELRSDIECYGRTTRPISALSSHMRYGYIPNALVQPVTIPGKGIPWSPLFELDLFPTSQNTRGSRRGLVLPLSSSPLIDMWDKDLEEWKLKLRKFRKTLPDHNPAIILSLEHLINLRKQRREGCLRLFCRLLAARQKESCPNGYKIMEVYLDFVMELLLERKLLDATSYLSRSLREAIQESQLSSEHPFHIRLSYIEAYILYQNGQYEEAESIIRLVIQKVLNNQNLDRNHQITSDALELLAFLIEKKNTDSYSEAEKLYRYNIHQTSKHGRSLGNTYFDNMSHLIDVLSEDGKAEEAHSICIYVMGYAELTLGKRHYWNYEYQERMGFILLYRGMISESIDVFQNILLEADDCHLQARTHYNLGYVLQKCGNFREAIVMYKRCLLSGVREEGWESWSSLKMTCERLSDCYEELSQFQDALFLYENLREKIKNVIGDHQFIKEVEGLISEVQERMKESSAVNEELISPHKVQQEGVDYLVYEDFSEGVVDVVSLREIFEIEDRTLDGKIVELGMQVTSIKPF